jgi:hypothetical protein
LVRQDATREKLGRERETERNSKIERFSPVGRESDPVENVLNFVI